jgi:hypothetical protein
MKKASLNAKERVLQNPPVNCNTIVIGVFFNARGVRLEKSLEGLYRSILHQLFQHAKEMTSEFVHEFYCKRDFLKEGWVWTKGELRESFKKVIKNALDLKILIYIDALDECDEKMVRKLVDFMQEDLQLASSTGTDLRICISSRHYPNIHVRDCYRIEMERSNESDISMYVSAKLRDIGQYDNTLQEQITSRSSSVFLWVVLVLQQLREASEDGEPPETISNILNSVPAGLEDLFSDIIASISQNERQKTILIILWILFA